jgi:hypothetical protein
VEYTHGDLNHSCPCNNPANKPTASPLNKCPTSKMYPYSTGIKKKKKSKGIKELTFPF